MIGPVIVSCRKQDNGYMLQGKLGTGAPVDPLELKRILFAWHERSYYGTLVDILEKHWALHLSPLLAVDYFASPAPLQHVTIQWDDSALLLQTAARHIREELAAGRFSPDFARWQEDRPAWRLLRPLPASSEAASDSPAQAEEAGGEDAEDSGSAYPWADWLDAAIAELLREDPGVAQSWQRLQQAWPAAARSGMAGGGWADEDDWLAAIGWRLDPAPFRCCLQLAEPAEDDTSWTLRILLQDLEQPQRLLPYDPAAPAPADEAANDPLPPHWREHLPAVRKHAARWQGLLPWLAPAALASAGAPEPAPALIPPPAPVAADRPDGAADPAALLAQAIRPDQAWLFLSEGSLRLVEAGYTVFLPKWWEQLKRTKPRLRAALKSSVGASRQTLFGLDQIMRFDWKLAIGDLELTEEEFRQIAEQKAWLIRIRGQWVQLSPESIEQIRSLMKLVGKKKGLSLRDILEIHYTNQDGDRYDPLHTDELDRDALQLEVELNEQLRSLTGSLTAGAGALPLIEPPPAFRGQLRRYQAEGVSWLLYLRSFGLGACLADDMGLGKTIQFICYLQQVKSGEQPGRPALLICPTSVIGNWQKELERFAPELVLYTHYGANRRKGEAFAEAAAEADLVLTSYALSHLDQEELQEMEWTAVCLDEAQNIKNAYTKQSSAIRALAGRHHIALTGTPIENRLSELWSIYDFLNPGYLGSLNRFKQRFVNPIETSRDPKLIARVQRLVRPFLLRRVKSDPAIELDLPSKDEGQIYVSLTAEQGALYESTLQSMFERLDRLPPMERRGLILATLTRLKQICDHPALLLKEELELEPAMAGGVASDQSGALFEEWLSRSNKAQRLLEMVTELREEGDSCLIFTQYVGMGRILQQLLRHILQEPVPFMHGGIPKAERDRMIARFQDTSMPVRERSGVFLLSLKTGGVGLNLTAASHVFHFDRWWNPAVENQATDRAHRIGQQRRVSVHKFVTLGTLEERIHDLIESKQGLSRQIIGSSENWITELSTDELQDLFSLRREWIHA